MKRHIIKMLFLISPFQILNAQPGCPAVSVSPANVSMCSGCTTLTAIVQGTVATTSYSVSSIPYAPFSFNTGTPILIGIDDLWSDTVSLPFCFDFYGNTYSKCIVGANGCLSFDLSNANNYNTWPIGDPIPTTNVPDLFNSIMAPWQDIDPTYMGSIYWELTGAAPCRQLIVSWDSLPYYGDPNSVMTGACTNPLWASQQIVLYETTNIIEINIRNKELCTGWNGGYAIEGIQNSTGTQAVAVPGRNYPALWTATNDSWRFTPTGAPQYTLTWYDGATPIGNNLSVIVCPSVTTTYTAQLVNNTCSGPVTVTDQATVTISPSFTLTTSSTPASCGGSDGTATVTITGGGTPPFIYLWSTVPVQATQTATGLSSGTYTVSVTDQNNCTVTATVNVASTNSVTASALVTGQNPICPGQSTTLTANMNGGTAPFNFLWSPASSLSSSSSQTVTATPAATTVYTVIITDVNGCTSSASCTVNISTPPAVTASGDVTVCPGETTILTGFGADIYTWSPPAGLNTTTGNTVSANPQVTTSYQVIGQDATTGCTDTASVTVNTSPAPIANFSITNSPQVYTLPVIFGNSSTGATSYLWLFGDASTDFQQDAVHQYNAAAVWPVCLIAYNAIGCVDTTCKDVILTDVLGDIFLPNVFSPNGDHVNDLFTPVGFAINTFEINIYNRWGETVYTSADYASGWDGSFKGTESPMGVYVYSVKVAFTNGDKKNLAGHVTLIR
ncbi:MAG: gliding motility-associated C-terminal domain-containing protein [Bacteroidia bacterium]|nr:gliding motility-associated C-terminal domain-containing protein [Bacteroidia bacterium]